jgi:hypothetical protein
VTWCPPKHVSRMLAEKHYLGPIDRGAAWIDEFGAIVITAPTSRRLPIHWLELARWCLLGETNGGSRQWSDFVRALRRARPDVSPIVSYSDPSQGHTGALYRACNWWWAPTWLRLRPPPTGNGSWTDADQQSIKDRWVFAMRPEQGRDIILRANDESILRRWPWAEYREPGGVPFKRYLAEKICPRANRMCSGVHPHTRG